LARILVVEDEAVLRLTFGHFLEDEGYEVEVAEDYNEALHHLDRSAFDVIVTDIILAGKTGVDLLRTIRQRGLDSRVIMITGEPNVETAAEAVRLGAFDYLPKPVTRDSLIRVTHVALEHKRIADERDHYAQQMDMYRRELEAIFNSVNEGIITVDADMRIRQVNSTAETILGLSPQDLNDKAFADILPGKIEPARQAVRETLKTHKAVVDRRIELSLPVLGERVLSVSTAPLLAEGGVFTGAVLTMRDLTRLTRLEKQIEASQQYRDIIGKSARMQQVFSLIKDLSETDSTVLIMGESGTGKELVAAALHHTSGRANGPFLKVNCAALSENILESELFGHVKGAFTGAVKDRMGRFEAANGGTILLDEIGDVSPRLQLRLLRVLQEREFERVGDTHPIRTDVRVIASTNQDLDRKIQLGEFRQDLYYRLNVVRLELPSLRERREDLPLLVDHFVRQFNRQFKKEVTGPSPETMQIFMQYPWPGNVRELENCIERAFIVCHDTVLLPEHLPPEFKSQNGNRTSVALTPSGALVEEGMERDRLFSVLQQTDWNVAKSARLLGMARNTLYQKMKTLHLERPEDV
jgi:PAS domain S-box-containing protein